MRTVNYQGSPSPLIFFHASSIELFALAVYRGARRIPKQFSVPLHDFPIWQEITRREIDSYNLSPFLDT
jgi:hypothetical protein